MEVRLRSLGLSVCLVLFCHFCFVLVYLFVFGYHTTITNSEKEKWEIVKEKIGNKEMTRDKDEMKIWEVGKSKIEIQGEIEKEKYEKIKNNLK